jgi:uncharacterized membrane protein HdeD (DUF308 family)
MNTLTPSPATPTNERTSLAWLYIGRGLLAIGWAIAFAKWHARMDARTVALLVAYPLLDAVASWIELQGMSASSTRRITQFNAWLSTLAAATLGIAGSRGTSSVLAVFGAWAIVSGAAQFMLGVRRRGPALGKQWPMLIAGGLSCLVGVTYAIQAVGDHPSLDVLAIYATGGGLFFIVQGGLLAWRHHQRQVARA